MIVPAPLGILKTMATLTDTAYYARKSVIYGVVGLFALVLFRFSWGIFSRWWIALHPPPPPPPTVSFGVLPEITFPKGVERKDLSFRLETVSGSVPNFGIQSKVYFMPAFRANVLGLELAKSLAAKLGFVSAPIPKDEQVYIWNREGALPGTLTVNLVTGHFSLDTAWYRDSEITSSRALGEQEATRVAQDYLRRAGLLTDDLSKGRTRIEYLQAGAGAFSPAISQSEANFTRVHLFRGDVNSLSVVTPQEDQALIQVIVSGARSQDKQVIGMTYKYSPIELDTSATYPLRSSQSAWEQFQAGEGVITRLVKNTQQVVVRDVKLAYYDADIPQQFLEPVYVFHGDDGLVGYVSAIDPKWLGKK